MSTLRKRKTTLEKPLDKKPTPEKKSSGLPPIKQKPERRIGQPLTEEEIAALPPTQPSDDIVAEYLHYYNDTQTPSDNSQELDERLQRVLDEANPISQEEKTHSLLDSNAESGFSRAYACFFSESWNIVAGGSPAKPPSPPKLSQSGDE